MKKQSHLYRILRDEWLTCVLIGIMLGLACVRQCEPVHAQSQDEGLLLATVFVSESGFDGVADHLPIANYTRRLARHWGAPIGVAMVRRYTRALAPQEARRSRPWLANLSRAPGAPRGWNENAQHWSERDAQWRAALARADAFLAGEVDAPRGCRPKSWGSPDYDAEQIASTLARGGWVVTACGATRNVFLSW